MLQKISLQVKWPPSDKWILFINEITHECEYFNLHPLSNITGLNEKFTHWLKEI